MSLYDGATQTQRLLQADLVLINPQFQTLFSVQSFSRERLYQALSVDDVASASSIYIASGQWKNPDTRQNRAILIWGVEPAAPSFSVPEVRQKAPQLQQLNQVLFDRSSRPEYGAIAQMVQKQGSLEAEVNRQMVQVTGLFTIGATFAADGNVITSDSTFLKLFPERQPNKIEVGLIQLQPGNQPEAVKAQLTAMLGNDVRVLTPVELAEVEKHYWESQGAIGFIFGLGVTWALLLAL